MVRSRVSGKDGADWLGHHDNMTKREKKSQNDPFFSASISLYRLWYFDSIGRSGGIPWSDGIYNTHCRTGDRDWRWHLLAHCNDSDFLFQPWCCFCCINKLPPSNADHFSCHIWMMYLLFFFFLLSRSLDNRLLVGAPLDQNLQPGTNRSGALWRCPMTTRSNDCIQVVTDGKRSTYISIHHFLVFFPPFFLIFLSTKSVDNKE